MFRVDPKQAVLSHISANADKANGVLGPDAETAASAPIAPALSHKLVSGFAQLIEALLLLALGLGIYLIYLNGADPVLYVPLSLGIVAAANIAFNIARTHRIVAYRTVFKQVLRVLGGWAGIFLLVVAGLFVFKAGDLVSRVWLVSWAISGGVLLVCYRLALRALVLAWSARGRLRRRTVIVGGGASAESLVAAIEKSATSDIELIGLFDDRDDERSPEAVAGLKKLGKVADLVEFARRARIDFVIVSMPLSAESRLLEMLRQLWVLPVDIRLSAHMSKLRFTDKTYSYVGDLPVFEMADRPISDWNLVFKWVFDKLVALFALIVLSPVMLATAIAVKATSKGPILFKQNRHGFNNELIEVYKFRSMYTDMSDAKAARLVTRDDPRVTPVGRFIRKSSIDELPQLFNVLKGELSIVGPRPHALEAKAANRLYHDAVDGYFARHKVKPGITGWAQINGWRGETDTVDKLMARVDHDLYYIENWSILLDLYILVMTPVSLFTKSENAF
ncbi:undecaprenyl-phosphate glucose phosphotransferase [Pelagibacterium halotolerans]|uniref:Putative glycosyl transferase n=1 Tax=Pelagibacterium halotolerans (strain DSM 22347 / JCM 15775 / CGMCC 1.7692 / B2) TaxID=1082931 RepID=G4R6I2_PELHB|nr:undecaprenyl-phosphate glucose phosphotransferase [Pelagibacterium halotolerans]AEQ51178.1 putative glycosyl transferase [Pelagibacterium halotolerans B2]QJR18955.1 undecaprenyl-phosphate glucose phosphotransferase [Pelagibacterium halotolerans]SEA68962.1 Undecaprenyl-phosphate glucose phosphotransferase [Pelagibacterium halotolerans]